MDAGPSQGSADASVSTEPREVTVAISAQEGVAGDQVVNFAVPLPRGLLNDESRIEVSAGDQALPAYRRALANYSDGTIRSVQLQVSVDVDTTSELDLSIGVATTGGDRDATSIEATLQGPVSNTAPNVWALLPATWLAESQFAGPALAHSSFAGTSLDAWGDVCDYERWDSEAFLDVSADRGPWLYDRVTANMRGYQVYGTQAPLASAFREAHIYRAGLSGSGADTRIGVPNADSDVKYHYVQGLALQYLLTGDDRFREAAESVALRMAELWPSPEYAGGSDFWTERHAGFALLAYVWAEMVSDDRSSEFAALADSAANAYFDMQAMYPVGHEDTEARCFSHQADAHGEDYGYMGCSPWMSAILADSIDAYAAIRSGAEEQAAKASLVQLGRAVARQGLDDTGKPYYWMTVDSDAGEVDSFDEHWGEPAYVVALAYEHSGRDDSELFSIARNLVINLADHGTSPHVRSFNWQCRSAVATPYFLRP